MTIIKFINFELLLIDSVGEQRQCPKTNLNINWGAALKVNKNLLIRSSYTVWPHCVMMKRMEKMQNDNDVLHTQWETKLESGSTAYHSWRWWADGQISSADHWSDSKPAVSKPAYQLPTTNARIRPPTQHHHHNQLSIITAICYDKTISDCHYACPSVCL